MIVVVTDLKEIPKTCCGSREGDKLRAECPM